MQIASQEASILGEDGHQLEFGQLKRLVSVLNKLQAMSRVFGPVNTARAAWDKLQDQESSREIQIQPTPLRHPAHIRRTFSDRWGAIEVFRDRVYELPDDIGRRARGKAIVDIGAYNGLVAAYFASTYPDSPIVAVEPNPKNVGLLTRNAAAYSGQITVVRGALLGTRAGVAKQPFSSRRVDSMANAFVAENLLPSATLEPSIEAVTPAEVLESLNDAPVGILKVDIEGAEKPLFEASSIDVLLEQTSVLLVETHDQFMPGASEAVDDAAARNGLLALPAYSHHTAVYYRT